MLRLFSLLLLKRKESLTLLLLLIPVSFFSLSGIYLVLALSGEVLSPGVDGYPNKLKVVE